MRENSPLSNLISMTVVRGNGSFHRLGLGSLDHCAVALAQIHCAFTSILFAHFTSTASPFPFSPALVAIRRDGARRSLPARSPGTGSSIRRMPRGQSRLLPAQLPLGIAGACSVLSCHIESCSGARRLSLPPRRFSLLPRSGRGHRFDHASVAVCRPLQDSTWIAWAAKSPNSVEVRTRPS